MPITNDNDDGGASASVHCSDEDFSATSISSTKPPLGCDAHPVEEVALVMESGGPLEPTDLLPSQEHIALEESKESRVESIVVDEHQELEDQNGPTSEGETGDEQLRSAVHEGAHPHSDFQESAFGNDDSGSVWDFPPEQSPFDREDVMGRTNTFPQMLQTPISPVRDENPLLPKDGGKHAQSTLQENNTVEVANGDSNKYRDGLWEDSIGKADDVEDGFFNQLKTQTKSIYVPPEAESRFEEGIPLVEDVYEMREEPTDVAKDENAVSSIFKEDEDGGDDFFKSTHRNVPETQLSSITRKSTAQVLDSLGFEQDPPVIENLSPSWHPSHAEGSLPLMDNLKKKSSEEDLAARWQAELDKEDDDFLLDDDLVVQPPDHMDLGCESFSRALSNSRTTDGDVQLSARQSSMTSHIPSNPYAPHQPSSSEVMQGLSVSSHLPKPIDFVASSPLSQVQQLSASESAESYSNRSKDGYKSPYDLPEDLSRPRRPPSHKTATTPPNILPLPSRSSSITTGLNFPPQPSSSGYSAEPVAVSNNFFEDLPPPPRQRPTVHAGYTAQSTAVANVVTPPSAASGSDAAGPLPPAAAAGDLYYQSQVQPPERVDPYSNLAVPSAVAGASTSSRSSSQPVGMSKTPSSSRYSPAPPVPPSQSSTLPPRSRYVSQPAAVPTPNALPFQPRTSSPLAHHEKHAYQTQESQEFPATVSAALSPHVAQPPKVTDQSLPIRLEHPFQPGYSLDDHILEKQPTVEKPPEQLVDPLNSPSKNPYAPVYSSIEPTGSVAVESPCSSESIPGKVHATPTSRNVPPRRSQTQSPGRQISSLNLSTTVAEPFQRPASVHGPSSPTKAIGPYAPSQLAVHNRGSSQQLEFIAPTDGQQFDPLERWKGAPVFKFGFGGSIITCFPKHIPRYMAGNLTPVIKSAPGETKVLQLRDLVPPVENIVRYPGPLKSKSKKKDVIAWLSGKIAAFENEEAPEAIPLYSEPYKRHDEKVLLWKVMRIMVENDGVLEGIADNQKSLRDIIFPGLQTPETNQVYNGDQGAYQPVGLPVQPDAIDSGLLERIRKDLLVGDREKAVWRAVDHRHWGHALIISSTLDKSIWRQVVQEFVRREVRPVSNNAESLAALYEIFAGNLEESIDELVPLSARAGLQMVSKLTRQAPTKNALDGLDRWRETLGLILENRSPDDHRALFALGRLLSSYGRIEASHICYIFARTPLRSQVFGGIDDHQACIVLLGADHHQFPATFFLDEDTVLLTEVYEFATTVLASSPTSLLPHFQAFKLQNAISLAEKGLTTDAQQYCDAIGVALKATTRPSPYYHPLLFSELDELSRRVRQAPSDGTSSWISKPSMEKVSGSMWAKFNSFVVGDDSDAGSSGSGKAGDTDYRPFANVAGTPTISRSPSVSDLYGSYPIVQPVQTSTSRYAPGSQHPPSSTPEQYRGRTSLESHRSPSTGPSYSQKRGSQPHINTIDSNSSLAGQLNSHGSPSAVTYFSTPPQPSYIPLAPVDEGLASQGQFQSVTSSLQEMLPSGKSGFDSEPFAQHLHPYESPETVSDPLDYRKPNGMSTYEPPSYRPDQIAASEDVEESPQEERPKKKYFMDEDEDEDLTARAAAIQISERERRDREADDTVRKAAEADAKKPSQSAKKSWFGGWFGGKKDSSSSAGPVRAKLGEENSFYYDADLKKWINKKDPNGSNASARATPPPPKGSAPQSRSTSAGNMSSAEEPPVAPQHPPSSSIRSVSQAGLGSRPSTGNAALPSPTGSPSLSSLAVPSSGFPNGMPRSASTGAPLATPPISSSGLTPPRPALSNASSIDDLLGAPQARKGNSVRAKKKGRGYVDVMAK
ncbi:Sec23-binding domain of Sec16 domain containing protein [Elaphomyces granulatus]